jgi:hypothetical protein
MIRVSGTHPEGRKKPGVEIQRIQSLADSFNELLAADWL